MSVEVWIWYPSPMAKPNMLQTCLTISSQSSTSKQSMALLLRATAQCNLSCATANLIIFLDNRQLTSVGSQIRNVGGPLQPVVEKIAERISKDAGKPFEVASVLLKWASDFSEPYFSLY